MQSNMFISLRDDLDGSSTVQNDVSLGPSVGAVIRRGSRSAHNHLEKVVAASGVRYDENCHLRATDLDPSLSFDKTSHYNTKTRVTSTLKSIEALVSRGGSSLLPDVSQIVKSFLWTFESGPAKGPKERDRYLRSWVATYKVVASCVDERMSEQAFVKYHLAVLMCAAFKDDSLPPIPPIAVGRGTLFTGYLKETIRKWLLRKNSIGRIYSLSQAKRDWPAVNQLVIDEALADHVKILGVAPKPVSFDLLQSIEFEGAELFGPNNLPPPVKFMPTGSACNEFSRKQGGTTQCVSPLVLPPGVLTNNQLGSLRIAEMYFEDWRTRELGILCRKAQDLIGDVTSLTVRVVPISEPSKVRSVSVMDGYLATAIQPAQGQLVSAWKKSPRSTMTIDVDSFVRRMYFARGAMERDVNDLIKLEQFRQLRDFVKSFPNNENYYGQCVKLVRRDDFYFMSVDYKKATDYLKSDATVAALRRVTGLYGRDIVDWSLRPAILTYPESKSPSVPSILPTAQLNGQLMGQPLSFPILCAINSACFNHALRIWRNREVSKMCDTAEFQEFGIRTMSLQYVRAVVNLKATFIKKWCLINGDDLLGCVPQSFKDIFYKVTEDVGLIVSIGKNYFSRNVALINSQLYRVAGNDMVRVGYLNLKLVTGVSPKTGESSATPMQCARDLNKMFALAPWTVGVLPAALGRFANLRFGRYQPNWFLPVHLGGYGVDLRFSDQDEITVTREQRKLAALFVNSPDLQIVTRSETKLSMRALKAIKHKLKYSLVKKVIGPKEQFAPITDDDEWAIRLTQIDRAVNLGLVDSAPVEPHLLAMKVWKRSNLHRLSPMSISGIRDWWAAEFVSSYGRVPCPPLNPFSRRELKFGLQAPQFLETKLEAVQHFEYQKTFESYLRETFRLEEVLEKNPLVQALVALQDIEYRTESDLHKGLLKVLMEGRFNESQ